MDQTYLNASYDPALNIVHAEIVGLASLEQMRQYRRELAGALAQARAAGPAARIIFDNRRAAVQTQEVMDEATLTLGQVQQPNDRVAIVVGSSLAKMQARRLTAPAEARSAKIEAFISYDAAMTWLLAFDGAGSAERQAADE